MFGISFYHRTLTRYITYFGSLFSRIHITHLEEDGSTIQEMTVPITHSPKQRFLVKLKAQDKEDGESSTKRPVAALLPRMAFEFKGMVPDPSRRLPRTAQYCLPGDSSGVKNTMYTPSPWNLQFSLYVIVKNYEDGLRIVEQIVPYFNPDWTQSVTIVPGMDIDFDVPITLNDVSLSDTFDGKFEDTRILVWQLDFTLKGFFFGPVSQSTPIKIVTTEFKIPEGPITDSSYAETPNVAVLQITPGLTANGEPTSNSSISVGIDNIVSTDNYGFIEDYDEFISGS